MFTLPAAQSPLLHLLRGFNLTFSSVQHLGGWFFLIWLLGGL